LLASPKSWRREPVAEVIFIAENAEHAEKNIIILCSLCDLSVLCGEKNSMTPLRKQPLGGWERGRVRGTKNPVNPNSVI
jgi:hypothetical protein